MLRQSVRRLRVFFHPVKSSRRRHTHITTPMHDANHFGGRSAQLREIGPINHRMRGRMFKMDPTLQQYNVDIWAAQQTLRKKWKSRDWDVIEFPFELAPKQLQRVIPELYTELPPMTDPANNDCQNIRKKVFDCEDLQRVLYPKADRTPYPPIQRVDKTKPLTLDKFFSL